MFNNLGNGHGVFNAGDNLNWALTLLAGFNIYVKYVLETLHPGYRRMTLRRSFLIPGGWLCQRFSSFAPFSGCDMYPVFAVGCEYPPIVSQWG